MSLDQDEIYRLLPAIYRVQDAHLHPESGPLRELVSVIAGEVAVLEEQLAQFYDDQFIETCAEWVVPYIGDLLGVRGLLDLDTDEVSQRSFVANTIALRRRKGTAAVLEQLAFDVTNWRANAVEYFERLASTQYMNHVRPGNESFASLGSQRRLDRIDTPFDPIARSVDVRRIASRAGKHNIPNVGIFLWRLGSYPVTRSRAVKLADGQRFMVNPLGTDLHLATRPQPEASIDHLATPLHVPMPLGRRELAARLDEHYGESGSIEIWIGDDKAVPEGTKPSEVITVCDLRGDASAWLNAPGAVDGIAIDPVLGRIAVGTDHKDKDVFVSFSYRFSAAMGGGEYTRRFADDPDVEITRIAVSNQATGTGDDAPASSIQSGLTKLVDNLPGTQDDIGIVEIVDSGRYREDPLTVTAREGQAIQIRAADGSRPVIEAPGGFAITAEAGSTVILDGLVIGGAVQITGEPSLVRIRHCTLVPGHTLAADGTPGPPAQASFVLSLTGTPGTRVEIDHSITGPLRLPADGCTLYIEDSIVDSTDSSKAAIAAGETGTDDGPPTTIERSTMLGSVQVRQVELVSDSIFTGPLTTTRRQVGCIRFSYLAEGSVTPQRYRCQPAPGADPSSVRPEFTSVRYGDPGYCQLGNGCPVEISRGASDEAEMGAFHDLYQPQREDALRTRLDEYLRFSLEAGIFHAS